MFRTLQLLKKCEKWYQKPAIEYSKVNHFKTVSALLEPYNIMAQKWRNHFLVRLEFLDWCITMNQYQFYTSLPCQDWEDFVNANCSKAVLFYQHCISSLLLLYTWVQDEYQVMFLITFSLKKNSTHVFFREFRMKFFYPIFITH
jgi:hypothetical protein